MCAFIRQTGVSDTAAASMVGVSRSALSRWKAEHEDEACQLERARTEYLLPRLKIISETVRKDGGLDWRAQAWLVKFAHPEEYGPPSRRRQVKEVEVPPTEEEKQAALLRQGCAEWAEYEPGGVVTQAMLVALQAKRQQMIRDLNPEQYDAEVAAEQAARVQAKKKTPAERYAYYEELSQQTQRRKEEREAATRPMVSVGPPHVYGDGEGPASGVPADWPVRTETEKR